MKIDRKTDSHRTYPIIRHDDHLADLLPAFVNGSLDPTRSNQARHHLAHCSECRLDFEAWVAIGSATRSSQTPTLLPSRDILDRVWTQIDDETATTRSLSEPVEDPTSRREERIPMLQPTPKASRRWLSRPVVGAVAAAALAAAIALTPIGGYAQGFLTVFTPKTVAAVPVSLDALKNLPDLNNYGTFTQSSHSQPASVTDAASAGAAAKLTVLTPATLPKGITGSAKYGVMPAQSASFTFSAAKAAAAAKGQALPTMPKNIDGSSVQVTTGAAVLATYGAPDETKINANTVKQVKANPDAAASLGSMLVIGQSAAPVVTSTGASAADLEAYLLAQPGISPDLSNAIRSMGDPTSTLPIPIPISKATSHNVQVQGVQGVSVADSTGLGGGIIWVKNGIVYGVAGTFSENDLLAVANSLH